MSRTVRCFGAKIVTFVVLLAGLACGCSRHPPNVLLIVIDTLRADRLGVYGNPRGLTPFMNELAARGTVFRNAYAPTSWTCPSVASLLTSRYAAQHHVWNFESVLAEEEVSLAEVLGQARYSVAGFTANFRLTQEQGYAQGFQTWGWRAGGQGGKLRGGQLRSWVSTWLASHWRAPAMLYVQYMEPHAPYEPPEPYRGHFQRGAGGPAEAESANRKLVQWDDLSSGEMALLESLYDGEVASVDAELRLLFHELEAAGFLDNAVIVITADHGEEFEEHGLTGHGRQLYNETVRVPLILSAPGYPGGRVVDENVSLIDIAPTLLQLASVPREPRFEGRSLVPLLGQRFVPWWLGAPFETKEEPPDVLLELPEIGGDYDLRRHTEGLIRRSTKLLIANGGEQHVYDLATDPNETAPDSPALNETKLILTAALERSKAARARGANAAAQRHPLDEATKEKLRALGYRD